MKTMMRWIAASPAVAAAVAATVVTIAAGAAVARAESSSGTGTGITSVPAAPSRPTAPKTGTQGEQLSEPQHHDAKPMPSPHRKVEVGTLKIANKQTRMFTLECETCAPEAKGQIYKAPPAMNLRALDGKRVRVTFDIMGKVQSVRRIDAHRRVSTGKTKQLRVG